MLDNQGGGDLDLLVDGVHRQPPLLAHLHEGLVLVRARDGVGAVAAGDVGLEAADRAGLRLLRGAALVEDYLTR